MPSYSREWFEAECPACRQWKHVRVFPAFGIRCAECYFADGVRVKTTTTRKSNVERPTENLVARVAYGTARRLGSATRTARDGLWGAGRLLGGGPGVLIRYSRAVGRRIRGGGARPAEEETMPARREDIRSIIIEELARLQAATEGKTLLDLEKRLRCMAQTIEAFQERLNELSAGGPISEADLWKELDSFEAAESLTNDERTLLAGVFRRNIALQKRALVGAAADSGGAEQP